MTMMALHEVRTAMLDKLATSDLDEADVRTLCLTVVAGNRVSDILPGGSPQGGFKIPYFDMSGNAMPFFRFRYMEFTNGFAKMAGSKTQRYTQPSGAPPEIYLPPFVQWASIGQDVSKPIFITEGEIKSACATKHGFPTIGLGGVWNFMSKKKGQTLLPQLKAFKWTDREVTIVYDSDAVRNANVAMAENALAKELTGLGAVVGILRLPDLDDKKTGLDDYLTQMGPESLARLLTGSARSAWRLNASLHRLNEEVCVIKNPPHVVRFKGMQSISTAEFMMLYAPMKFVDTIPATLTSPPKFVKRDPAKEWLEWPCRPSLERIAYHPGKSFVCERVDKTGCVEHELNAWSGWACEPKKGTVKPFLDLLEFLTRKEPKWRKWLLQWLAYPIQHPGTKMYSAVMMWGLAGGTGKTLLGETMKIIYGENFTLIDDNDLSSTFNAWAKHKQFALGDEITKNESHGLANKLKGLITRTGIRINEKGVKQYDITDCINYYFTSNHPDALFLSDTERRYFVVEVIGKALGDDFYATYDAWYKSPEGAAALFDFMLHVDLEGFNPTAAAPHTDSKAEMVEMGHGDLYQVAALLRDDPQSILRVDNVASTQVLWESRTLHAAVEHLLPPRTTPHALSKMMKSIGMRMLNKGMPITVGLGRTARLWAILEREATEQLPNSKIISLYNRERT